MPNSTTPAQPNQPTLTSLPFSVAPARRFSLFPVPALASLPTLALRLVAPARPAEPAAPLFNQASLPSLTPQDRILHDMRNALCSLVLLADVLHEPGALNHPHQHLATSVSAIADTLCHLTDTLATSTQSALPLVPDTELAGPASGPTPGSAAPSDTPLSALPSAGEAVQACTPLLRAVAGAAVPVYVSSEHTLPPLALAQDQLQRVLMNLVRNAADAIGPEVASHSKSKSQSPGGSIRITARRALSRTSPAILIHVHDNGPGIPAHALPRIFEPGYSSKGAIGQAGAPSGLGLTIVRELIESVGGSVQVASTRHRGTTFELRIPCLSAHPSVRTT
jgi:signal transduction histidine kinase